ncbi:MAG: metal-dependent hydrolase [Clostridia bacterium BRH_c25]|nr:MAG: metal-dependent hydrolase [Clostridia bacterium BRH_c25]
MKFRISPVWWPLLGITSPILVPLLLVKNKRFRKAQVEAARMNEERIEKAGHIELPEVDFLELDVLVEWKVKKGFMGDAGVSYLFRTESGSMLYDVGHGPSNPALLHNAKELNFNLEKINALTISHLHKDHMGGLEAAKKKTVLFPKELMSSTIKPCFLPDESKAEGFREELIKAPRVLTCGIASTGPLARSLFTFGHTEEQALVVKLKNKGLAVFTGCGHPTIEVILKMVRKISDEPIYAIGGGLHFPIGEGRGNRAGVQFQTIFGTGKPPWEKVSIDDLNRTIDAINKVNPQKVYLSAHDSSDFALDHFEKNLKAATHVLKAGESYSI